MESHENPTATEEGIAGEVPQRPERMDAAESRWDPWCRVLYLDLVTSVFRSTAN